LKARDPAKYRGNRKVTHSAPAGRPAVDHAFDLRAPLRQGDARRGDAAAARGVASRRRMEQRWKPPLAIGGEPRVRSSSHSTPKTWQSWRFGERPRPAANRGSGLRDQPLV